jgi:hypothetical protein
MGKFDRQKSNRLTLIPVMFNQLKILSGKSYC